MHAPSFDRLACRCCPSCAATEYTSTVWVHSRAPNFAIGNELAAALAKYEAQRVDYTNKQAIFARYLDYVFHRLPWPLRTIRDAVFDHTRFLERMLVKNYLRDAEAQMLALDL